MTRLPVVSVALALALSTAILPACGSDDDDDGASGDAGTTSVAETAPTPDLKVRTGNAPLSFDRKSYEVDAGDVTIEFTSADPVAHNVRVQPADKPCCTEFDIGGTDTISGGETTTGTLNLKKGRYILYCSIGSHWRGGMKSKLAVN